MIVVIQSMRKEAARLASLLAETSDIRETMREIAFEGGWLIEIESWRRLVRTARIEIGETAAGAGGSDTIPLYPEEVRALVDAWPYLSDAELDLATDRMTATAKAEGYPTFNASVKAMLR
jgi:hypothetical protein